MSSVAPSSSAASPAPATSTPTTPTVAFTMVGSYSTVQVLSPTQVIDVVYCTIQTQPSGVIASLPVDNAVFSQGQAGPLLTTYAQGIEAEMTDPRIIGAVGEQVQDVTGLLFDSVAFTVQYIDPVLAPHGITALAVVPNGLLTAPPPPFGFLGHTGPGTIIDAVYASLQAAAGG